MDSRCLPARPARQPPTHGYGEPLPDPPPPAPRWIASEAHARGMGAGLKNDLGQISALVIDFDFFVNE
jgi:hypothetical protein